MSKPTWPVELAVDPKLRRECVERVRRDFSRRVEELEIESSLTGALEGVYVPLALWIDARRPVGRPLIVGIHGGQGSGKSTLCDFLSLILQTALTRDVVGFSIDDLYLTHTERLRLAERVHPMLATRGVPGTHDVELGLAVLEQLRTAAEGQPTPIPSFDKSRDDRRPQSEWKVHRGRPDVVVFEGWCVGTAAQTEEELAEPINDLERREDPEGTWRRYVNDHLAGPYRDLFGRLDLLVMMKVPSMEKVFEWRCLQEERLIEKVGETPETMSPEQVREFIMYYERTTRHALNEMPGRTDICLEIDSSHQISRIHARRPRS